MDNYNTLGSLEQEKHTRLWYRICDISRFEGLGEEVAYPRGTIIAEAGHAPDFCWFVIEGKIIASEYTVATGERYYNFNEEDSLLMEGNVLLGRPNPVNFIAATDVRLLKIPAQKFLDALDHDPELAQQVLLSLSYKFLTAMDEVREATQCNVNWKVCNLLITFADRYGVPYDGKILIKEKLSQQMMANLLGVNRITMVRIIKELREAGLVEQVNGFYCIRDKEKLKQYMQSTDEKNR